jgi:superfamily II DNA or RNA helicase/HKD family nuclease
VSLPRGLYDQAVTDALTPRIAALPENGVQLDPVSGDDATRLLLDVLGRSLERIVQELPGTEAERVAAGLELVNELLVSLRERSKSNFDLVDRVSPPVRRLRSVHPPGSDAPPLPATGLAQPWLFTAAKSSPSLFQEIRREAIECDRIDILVSFITTSGVRKLLDVLQSITSAGASGAGRTRIRVLTTTYIGATEIEALDALARLNGCTVKVSLDGRRTRLHAKAWIFHRDSGFGTAYVGSANLSAAALLGGLEWTVKFTERGQEALYARAKAHFDTLWEDDEFQRYDPENLDSRQALTAALLRETGAASSAPLTFFEIHPKRYQQDMLDQLQFERDHKRNRNLLVAATGTGKTVVAALDYRRTVHAMQGARPRLLFVAHREQILKQGMKMYREVLRDGSFGDLLVGGADPQQHDHLFASIDSIVSRGLVARFGPDYWHTVVIDECHRLAAPRLDAFARAISPAILLGLTATPERSDGQPLAPYFTSRPDGSPAAELRLWDALDLQLLAPFEYFGCDDTADFSLVPWDQPGEREAIDRVVTGDAVRARMIIQEWHRLAGDARRTKSLVFCVSVAHARFMTSQFAAAGLKAVCVTGEMPPDERRRAPELLARGEICAIVTVDLYNEGVDIPEVDTLLFLRPTQSPVLFQQQLGRGLRLWGNKASCLVLDFVGQHRADFRFDRLLSSVTGLNRRQLLGGVEQGFSSLPSGCHIQLQSRTREQVLGSLRSLVSQNWRRLKAELAAYASLRGTRAFTLAEFVSDQQLDLRDIYRAGKPSGWTSLRRDAGLLGENGSETDLEYSLSRSMGRLLHIDDPAQLQLMQRVAERGAAYEPSSPSEALRAQMLTYQMDPATVQSYHSFVSVLSTQPHCLQELGQLTAILESRSRVASRSIPGLDDLPMVLHGRYRIREILTAVGWLAANRRTPFQSGVLPLKDRKTELLFVTLDKSTGYHDRIAYHDYAISPSQFHWQTQNAAGPHTASGRRYLESGTNSWSFQLFVRTDPDAAYSACGPVRIDGPEDISGDRPMSIRWKLGVPLPIHLFREFSVLRGGE